MEMADKQQRVTLVFEGRVQGVGFRFTAVDIAARHRITGYVRNEWDGTVSVVAEGRTSAIEAFIAAIYRSHLGMGIHNEQRNWTEATGEFERFEIRYG